MKAVVFFSGGLMSWAAAKRTVEKYGSENTTLLFTDTLTEDADLYRFIEDAAENVGAEYVRIAEGRDVWQVFNDEKMIGNTRADPCSRILKREPGEAWIKENCDPESTVLVFGIHWEEEHRLDGLRKDPKTGEMVRRGVRPRYEKLGWPHVEAPMCDKPWMTAAEIREWARSEGLELPRLYGLGFAHNNCGGFCVKAGEGHFAHLLKTLPQLYAYHEDMERQFNESRPGKKPQTVMAPEVPDGKGGRKRVPITMKEFREKIEANDPGQFDMFNLGGCGCFLDE